MRKPFSLDPTTTAAAARAAEADKAARRDAVDPARADKLVESFRAGEAPAHAHAHVGRLAELLGVPATQGRSHTPDEIVELRALLTATDGTTTAAVARVVGDVEQEIAEEAAEAAATNEADIRSSSVPTLDLDDLLGDLRDLHDHVREVARSLHLPVAMPAMWALSLVSALVADRVRGRLVEDPATGKTWGASSGLPLHFWTLGVADSGRNKSAVTREMRTDILDQAAVRADRAWRPVLALDRLRRHDADAALKPGRREVSEADRRCAMAVKDEPAMCRVEPVLSTVTPEEAEARMFRSGFVALMQDEAGAFFSDFVHLERSKLEAVLGGFSGSRGSKDTRNDTKAGDRAPFHERHCVLGLMVQGHKLASADPKDRRRLAEAAAQGLFARFVVHVDDPAVAPPADTLDAERKRSAAKRYEDLLCNIGFHGVADTTDETDALGEKPAADLMRLHPLAPRTSADADAKFAGRWLDFEADAARRVLDFQHAWQERGAQLARDGAVATSTVARRLGEIAARVAALRAIVRASRVDRLGTVTLDDVNRAIRFCERFAWPHAQHVLDESEAGELEALERKVLRALDEHRGKWFTAGQFKDKIARRWPEVRSQQFRDRVSPHQRALESLAERGRLRKRPTSKGGAFEFQIV